MTAPGGARPTVLPAMDPDQEATWHALIELAAAHPADWCLVGGRWLLCTPTRTGGSRPD